MVISNVSLLGQNISQNNNLKDLRYQIIDLQRQISSQKKSENYSGLGTEANSIQRMRAETSQLEGFMKNIDNISTRTEIMSISMSQVTDISREVINNIQLQTQNGEIDLLSLKTVAQENLVFLQDLMNSEHDGRFLFSGTDVNNAPFDNAGTINTNMQNEIANWLNSTQTPSQLLNNVETMSDGNLGYSSTLSTAGDVYARVDTNIEINYTVMGNNDGFRDIMRGMALAANLEFPDPNTDTATEAEFHQILDEIVTIMARGTKAMDQANFDLSSRNSLMENIKGRHLQDTETLTGLVLKTEEVDTAELITKLQTTQNQLTASYEVARIVNSLSLINFI